MAQKLSKTKQPKLKALEELKALVEYAKANKIMKVKVEGFEFELHPLALQEGLDLSEVDKETIEQMEMRLKKEAAKEAEDLLFYSANAGRSVSL